MQFKMERREARAQFAEEPLGVIAMLKPENEIVGVTDDVNVAARRLPPFLYPQIKDVVQIHVRKQRADETKVTKADLKEIKRLIREAESNP